MNTVALESSNIVETYRSKTRESAALSEDAAAQFPSGITHDSRHVRPYGVFVEKAVGSHKWDVDGNEYIDYFGGHGALLLGHGRPEVLAAIHEALDEGTHFGASHPRAVSYTHLTLPTILLV